jgi:hypothetical protein
MSVLACAGHLLIDLPIFMGPVVVLVGWLLLMTRKARRQEAASESASVRLSRSTGPSEGRLSPSASLPEGRLSL